MYKLELRSWVAMLGVFASLHAHAIDSFVPGSNLLSLDTLLVGNVRYTNLVATMSAFSVLEVGSPPCQNDLHHLPLTI